MYAPKSDKPALTFQKNNSSQKVTAWGRMCGNGILLGPFFFEGNFNRGNYLEILDNVILPQLNERFHYQTESWNLSS